MTRKSLSGGSRAVKVATPTPARRGVKTARVEPVNRQGPPSEALTLSDVGSVLQKLLEEQGRLVSHVHELRDKVEQMRKDLHAKSEGLMVTPLDDDIPF